MGLKTFTTSDGRELRVVSGFRRRILDYRTRLSPRADWTDEQFAEAARTKQRRLGRLAGRFAELGGVLGSASVLDVGCGDGSNCILLALRGAKEVTGIDLNLPLGADTERGRLVRRLTGEYLGDAAATVADVPGALAKLPLRFAEMDVTRLEFPDASFDWLLTRSAMEHIRPIEPALAEMARVVKPGGLIYLSIDPFYWVRGCHKRGVIDIPFAHARMSLADFRRFVQETGGEALAAKRHERIASLNRYPLRQWRALVEQMPCEILEWKLDRSEIGELVLAENPGIETSLLPGVSREDLAYERVRIWLRRR